MQCHANWEAIFQTPNFTDEENDKGHLTRKKQSKNDGSSFSSPFLLTSLFFLPFFLSFFPSIHSTVPKVSINSFLENQIHISCMCAFVPMGYLLILSASLPWSFLLFTLIAWKLKLEEYGALLWGAFSHTISFHTKLISLYSWIKGIEK